MRVSTARANVVPVKEAAIAWLVGIRDYCTLVNFSNLTMKIPQHMLTFGTLCNRSKTRKCEGQCWLPRRGGRQSDLGGYYCSRRWRRASVERLDPAGCKCRQVARARLDELEDFRQSSLASLLLYQGSIAIGQFDKTVIGSLMKT